MNPEYNEKMLAAKAKLLARFKARGKSPSRPQEQRLPPGQHWAKGFPVLDLGVRPRFHPKRWRLAVEGAVEHPLDVAWDEFVALGPKSALQADFHCVTTWSKQDAAWGGLPFLDLAALVMPLPTARYVIAHSADGYSTNIPLQYCLEDDCMLAYELDGEKLALEHGGPMRLVVSKLYAWKSAKFLRKLVFAAEDQPGFWEQRGYHSRGEPWAEERYA